MEELKDEIPSSINFDVGYYEKRTSKCWLVTAEDLGQMYSDSKTDKISLWCIAEVKHLIVDIRRDIVVHRQNMMWMNTTRHGQA